ncbi:phage terminase small subunit P27 family [Consotaella aegiceratis]|uniref:phage terminase small subunit P27 family n=1 Tax=Consotaella aegiceratis TaxID=3097961 RepID=UPI002F430140
MARGRKAELKAVDGGLAGVPHAPETIPASLRGEWDAIAADMVARKILTTPALGLLETYLIARWTVQEAQKTIAEHGVLVKAGHGQVKPNPASGLLSKALESVARLGAELGITPAARSKGQFQAKGGQADEGAPADLDI